jgi:phenylalanyl-tRNA synthetase beta chain
LPGLLEAVANARRHGESDVRLFTIGPVFLPSATGDALPDERPTFAAVIAGSRAGYLTKPEPVDAWDAKGLAVGFVFRLTGTEPIVLGAAKDSPPHLHPRGAAFIEMQNARIGTLGPLHPDVAEAFDVGRDLVALEIDLLPLADLRRAPRYRPIPRFPASTRDIALVVHDDVPAGAVEKVVRAAAGELAERVALFDRFTGGAIPKDHTSLAFHVVYRAPDRTLTEIEVDACHAKVVKEASAKFGATLRE